MVSRLKDMLGITKIQNLKQIIEQNGGLKNSYKTLFRTDDLKLGRYVGTDEFGNKYYENPYYFFGRNRWVIYSDKVGLNYDASMVPPEWFGWLHYRTDYTPCDDPGRPVYKWMAEHTVNLTCTNKQYVPYSSTREKIEAWQPSTESTKDLQAWQPPEGPKDLQPGQPPSSEDPKDLQPGQPPSSEDPKDLQPWQPSTEDPKGLQARQSPAERSRV